MTALDIAELRTLFLFERLTDEQLTWIAERGETRTYDEGARVYQEGEPATHLYVLIEGRLQNRRLVGGDEMVITETSQRGVYAGAVRSYVPSTSDVYVNSVVTTAPSRFFRLGAPDFATLMRDWFPMAVHLLDGLFLGIRSSEAQVRQREHLANLGTLSANLAHELNNPAAATVRATGQLRERVAGMRHKLGLIAAGPFDPDSLARLIALQERAVEHAAKSRTPLLPVEEADLEDLLVDRLEDLGLAAAYDLAAVFVAAGLDAGWLDEVERDAGGAALEGALRWLGYTLETEALMDEYDRSLPHVPAYPGELNQVWTNLIDNAADAIHGASGTGTLTLRTRREGDHAVVDVADDGAGIPPEVRPRVYEAFFTTKPRGEGSGLGLDNARRIVVQRHSGQLDFETGPDGTTFRVRLPLTAP